MSEPIPPSEILQQPLLPMPALKEKDKIDNFCFTINNKLRNLFKKKQIWQCLKFINLFLSLKIMKMISYLIIIGKLKNLLMHVKYI